MHDRSRIKHAHCKKSFNESCENQEERELYEQWLIEGKSFSRIETDKIYIFENYFTEHNA